MVTVTTSVADCVTVRRWRAQYLVPSTHPSPARLRDRLDTAVRDDMPGLLAAQLARTIDPHDPGLVFVRQLRFDIAIDAAWDRSAIAAQCAWALSISLSRALAGDDAGNVVRFPNRSAYLASFLVDTAAGTTAVRWYYAAFSGLVALPCGAAIRTALLDDPAAGIAALRTLADGDLTRVIGALGVRESARVCDALAHAAPTSDVPSAVAHLIAAAAHAPASGLDAAPQLALWLVARATIPADRALVIGAQALALVLEALASGRATLDDIGALLDEDDAAPTTILAPATPEMRAALRACRRALLHDLPTPRGREVKPDISGSEAAGHTPFGGGFLLLDDLLALPLADVTSEWPHPSGTEPARALSLLVLACACGGTRAPALVADPLWRQLFGIHPALSLDQMADWIATLGHPRRRMLVRALARHRRDRDAAVTSHALAQPDARYRVHVDENGTWRALVPTPLVARVAPPATADEVAALVDDLEYLMPSPDVVPVEWRLVLLLAAQQVLRAFARRIPGYAGSHLRYLQRNFLDVTAVVEPAVDRIVVRLTRPPLALILNSAGVNRGTRRWPRLDPRPFALFTED